MRLLFDEQLSSRLPRLLADHYPDSLHVQALDLGGAPDVILWQVAVVHGCCSCPRTKTSTRLSERIEIRGSAHNQRR